MERATEDKFLNFYAKINSTQLNLHSRKHKKKHGQFMTPASAAKLMAIHLSNPIELKTISILEPAAGRGILIAALFDQIVNLDQKPEKIEITSYEIDRTLIAKLFQLKQYIQSELSNTEIKIIFNIKSEDFLLSQDKKKFDLIITNPPYFKIRADDARCKNHRGIIKGQPNIYSLFMSKCSELLAPNGKVCYLTPRSWISGPYFELLRQKLTSELQLTGIHVFNDKNASFPLDQIQQDSIITWFQKKHSRNNEVSVSASEGSHDINQRIRRKVNFKNLIPNFKTGKIIIPQEEKKTTTLNYKNTLSEIGLRASTGKVVPFRATKLITSEETSNTKPLIWMQHIKRMEISWPLERKNEHIISCVDSQKLSIPGGNYVLMRRFSPRQSPEHVIASPLLAEHSNSIYIENHVNVISCTTRNLSKEEAIGLADYLNSDQVRDYFLAHSSNTQINAGDINSLPTPPLSTLSRRGKKLSIETKNN